MKCKECKKYLKPRWCDNFDIETDPEKDCEGCPEATPKKNERVRMNLRTVSQLVKEYYDKYGYPSSYEDFDKMARHFYMQGFNNGALEENRAWTLKQASKEVTSSKDNARKFLESAGIITKKGNLHPRYK